MSKRLKIGRGDLLAS